MSKLTPISLTVHYINGESYQFEFMPQQTLQGSPINPLQQILGSHEIIIELEDRLLVIPMENIQAIEISPPPSILPDTAIRNAEQVD